jgi:YidC/Oxa1 family membrane protein insertase
MWATRGMPGGINSLLCIFIVLLIIRGATLFISLRASIQTEKMMEIRSQTADINAKYKGLKDLASMQQKRIEIQALQKKHHVKPFAQFEQIMVTLPVYMIIYRLVTIVRPIKSTNLFGI